MYKDQIYPEELREAISDCWFWMFGKDPIYNQMLEAQFKKHTKKMDTSSRESLLGVINGIELIAKDFKDSDVSQRSISKLRVLCRKCYEVALDVKKIDICEESKILEARESGLKIAASLGFGKTDQVKIATAISELARNIILYAGSGQIELVPLLDNGGKGLKIVAMDNGPGIDNLDSILNGNYHSRNGLGIGLLGTKRLSDDFSIETSPGNGTKVVVLKYL
jgi:serine/threonine-protein kinase RsbT